MRVGASQRPGESVPSRLRDRVLSECRKHNRALGASSQAPTGHFCATIDPSRRRPRRFRASSFLPDRGGCRRVAHGSRLGCRAGRAESENDSARRRSGDGSHHTTGEPLDGTEPSPDAPGRRRRLARRRPSRAGPGLAADKAEPKKVLFFTKSSGFQHSVITRKGGKLGLAERILTEIGKEHGFEVVASKDGRTVRPRQDRPVGRLRLRDHRRPDRRRARTRRPADVARRQEGLPRRHPRRQGLRRHALRHRHLPQPGGSSSTPTSR